jgi:uncharacterized protein YbaR (Trm112 family)
MLTKANFDIRGDRIQFSLPFSKVDKERRTVSGFATLDNPDKVGDVVTAEASAKAFSRWRGNIREMHQPIAVGKAMDFSETEFYDERADKTYRGVFVTAYVSKGAESTWEKVLDGTLTGVSIGGSILEKADDFDKASGKKIRVIKDYDLTELSLVDSPCNQLANFMSIEKSDEGEMIIKGMAVDVRVVNVLYCDTDQLAYPVQENQGTCPACAKPLVNLGWIEDTGSDKEKAEAIKTLIERRTPKAEPIKVSTGTGTAHQAEPVIGNTSTNGTEVTEKPVQKNSEGGIPVTEKTETVEKSTAVAEAPAETAEAEKAAAVDEVATTEETQAPDFESLFTAFADKVVASVEGVKANTEEAVAKAQGSFEEAVGGLKGEVSTLAESFKKFDERLTALESEGAERTSEEVTKVTTTSEDSDKESLWKGSFLSADSLTKI